MIYLSTCCVGLLDDSCNRTTNDASVSKGKSSPEMTITVDIGEMRISYLPGIIKTSIISIAFNSQVSQDGFNMMYPPVIKRWQLKMDHLSMNFLAINLHSVRGFSSQPRLITRG